jgi:hypothetical protein
LIVSDAWIDQSPHVIDCFGSSLGNERCHPGAGEGDGGIAALKACRRAVEELARPGRGRDRKGEIDEAYDQD